MLSETGDHVRPEARQVFPTTCWTVVLDAQNDDADALARFCRSYWYPLYSYARKTGMNPADAEDLTQSFFERLISREILQSASRERGRLRSFLLQSFRNFAAEGWRRRAAEKRGGKVSVVAIDVLSAEERFTAEVRSNLTPEVEYDRAWARELFRTTLNRLRDAYHNEGGVGIFEALKDQLVDGASGRSYREIAEELGVTEAAARFSAFKLRQRYRAFLTEVVAETVALGDDVGEELAYLRTLFQK